MLCITDVSILDEVDVDDDDDDDDSDDDDDDSDDDDDDDESGSRTTGARDAAVADDESATSFDAVMGILAELKVEVPVEARLRIQAELLDQVHALEEERQRIRQLEEKVECLTALVKANEKGKGR